MRRIRTPDEAPSAAGDRARSQPDPADPTRDERLAPLVHAIEGGDVRALSLDCFDTLCGRAVARPVLAFARVGERLAERRLLAPSVAAPAFVALRSLAEVKARRRRPGRGEVHLDAIYAELPAELIAPRHRAEAVAVELEVERELLIVDPAVVAVAELARARGLPVAIVSDTYFSAAQLRELLRGAGATLVPDVVLTSSDAGLGKSEGLLRALPARLGVPGRRIAHLGDHPAADVGAAIAAGLRAFPFPQADVELRSVLGREAALTLENASVDGGLTFLRRRAAARAPVSGAGARHFRVGATVLGPLFTAFADWVVDALVEAKASGALCFMREGEFVAELADAAARARGEPLDLATLWISRAAAFRASIATLDEATLLEALARRELPRVGDFCRGFGLDPSDAGLPDRLRGKVMEGATARRVFAALLRPATRAWIEREARAQRKLLAELVLAAAPPAGPIACVDLGWGGTIQRHLVAALRLAGVKRDVLGLYLAASTRCAAAMMEGSSVRGFLASPGEHDALAELVSRSPEILEQTCATSAVGSALAYERDREGRAVPVLERPPADPEGARERAAARDGIRFFQAQAYALRRPTHGPFSRDELRRILVRFLLRPLEREAELFAGWWHDENYGTGMSLAIAPRVPRAALALHSGAELYYDRTLPWPAGTAAQGHPTLADELAAFALLGAFGPGDSPFREGERAPTRYLVADELDAAARAWAPAAYRVGAWAAARLAQGSERAPVRYRVVDVLNERLKRVAPSLHARAKAAAADAIGRRGGLLWPQARRTSVWPERSPGPRRGGKRR